MPKYTQKKKKTIKMSLTVIVNFEVVYKIVFGCPIKQKNKRKATDKNLYAITNTQQEFSERMEPLLVIYQLNYLIQLTIF